VLDACLQKKTPVSRGVKRVVRVDIGLIAASIALLAVGFALTCAIGPATTGSQPKPTGTGALYPKSFDLAVSVGSQIPDGSGVRVARSDTESALAPAERASEASPASAPCAAFDERFYFDQQLASFDERFASAFGSSGNAAAKAAEVVEPADNMLLQQLDFGEHAKRNPPAPRSASELPSVTTSRLASVREERLSTAAASMGLSVPLDANSRTAIYDIAARTVYLPDGHRLEAHSGLGSHLDDARYVDTKGQGPTPPNVYNLALRERLFHGVRAIRLIPVGDAKMFGRDGMLAHSYMLGPSGQSNGCVSFRNYPAFLSAFLRGEVDRLVVVEHLATATGAKTNAPSGG
jgi:Protein of unknown function (DUF2778)